jgi:hypothetical protein
MFTFNAHGGKSLWFILLIEAPCWSWTYLGFHSDFAFDEPSRTVYNAVGKAVWKFTSGVYESLPLEENCFFPYARVFSPWRDVVVRLMYVHLIDNAVQVLWLRYLAANAPYTSYINNSEILTILLGISLAVYTCARIRTHVAFLPSEKDKAPIAIQSAATDLMSFYTPHHKYRTTVTSCWCAIAFAGFTSIYIKTISAFEETAHWILGALGFVLFFASLGVVMVQLEEEVGLGEEMRERHGQKKEGYVSQEVSGEEVMVCLRQLWGEWWSSRRRIRL